jgi:predicted tellurium resistance membrane protein TerC
MDWLIALVALTAMEIVLGIDNIVRRGRGRWD